MSRTSIETLVLLSTAVLVRALLPEATFFSADQVGVFVEARGVLEGHVFPQGPGVGWTQFTLGPLFEWVTALGLLPRNTFSDVIVWLAMIHGLSVLGWRRLFAEASAGSNPLEARVAGWVLALHPMSMSSGSAPVSTSIVMPTTLLFVWGNLRWVRGRSPLGFALACVGAALMLQSHITTMFLLPLLLVGFRRKAPIGRIGLAGLAIAIVLISPMALHNLSVLGTSPWQHAGTAGGSLFTALGRVALLEVDVLGIAASLPATWLAPIQAAGLVWAAFMFVGAVVVVRRRDDGSTRRLVFFGLVLVSVCVALLPRGALLLYIDATIPFRCWLVAIGVSALTAMAAKPRAKGAAMVVGGVALITIVSLATFALATRFATAARGFASIDLARWDLRVPSGPARAPVGILTLGSMRELGRALDALGVAPESVDRAWHGPWRWAGAQSAGLWISESRGMPVSERSAAVGWRDSSAAAGEPEPVPVSFVVLHDDDAVAVPPSTPARAGRFRIYPFDDRLRITANDDEQLAAAVAGVTPAAVTVQVVTDAAIEVARLELPTGDQTPTRSASSSGFLVWSTAIDAADDATLRVTLRTSGTRILQIHSPTDAYAFATGSR